MAKGMSKPPRTSRALRAPTRKVVYRTCACITNADSACALTPRRNERGGESQRPKLNPGCHAMLQCSKDARPNPASLRDKDECQQRKRKSEGFGFRSVTTQAHKIPPAHDQTRQHADGAGTNNTRPRDSQTRRPPRRPSGNQTRAHHIGNLSAAHDQRKDREKSASGAFDDCHIQIKDDLGASACARM